MKFKICLTIPKPGEISFDRELFIVLQKYANYIYNECLPQCEHGFTMNMVDTNNEFGFVEYAIRDLSIDNNFYISVLERENVIYFTIAFDTSTLDFNKLYFKIKHIKKSISSNIIKINGPYEINMININNDIFYPIHFKMMLKETLLFTNIKVSEINVDMEKDIKYYKLIKEYAINKYKQLFKIHDYINNNKERFHNGYAYKGSNYVKVNFTNKDISSNNKIIDTFKLIDDILCYDDVDNHIPYEDYEKVTIKFDKERESQCYSNGCIG